ncbi:glycerol-3-phosphate dehydrogenase/oxidase [Rhodobacteraceae bacterium RKSG542]|uniref:glycerol-3-phosphate dehydrogenase/oxidase n=1 Tax=Pseudovibrio flavus TaxID=2529854 RepID=UPI0012BB4F50|nr:glycerol-3-phosphate dehydrogenase/oxidase [Pseudovibrio flavus]MTI17295.1 glycerol-3-phosphate dehydrogenase/oxidase [Pseudovibrio flavus]
MSEIRQTKLDEIKQDSAFDAVVIGGGVNGIGVYRDLALQGLRVLLVERNDFCSGCSAAPSRMIHGGLRYLENGEFSLVRESLQERDALLRNAPHFVRPLPTVIPITSIFSGLLNGAASFFGWNGKPSNRGVVPIKLGLALYDWVTRSSRILPRHYFNSGRATRAKWPQLTSKVHYSAVYHDAWISHPERLCMEMIGDACENSPTSIALNYAQMKLEGDQYVVVDGLSGEELAVTPKVIVNASGAWLDETAQALASDKIDEMVSGTKGSHLILANEALVKALDGHMIYFENTDGRVCIAFPYQGHVLAGSTDIRVDKAARERCEPEEQDYILESLNLVFPNVSLSAADVVFSFSGIRPLPKSSHGYTGRITRGHYTKRLAGSVPQICMIGGKWTTFRAFAEQASDEVLAELGKKRSVSTLGLTIGGGTNYPRSFDDLVATLCKRFGVSRERAVHLADHYGSLSFNVQGACSLTSDSYLSPNTLYTRDEIAFLIKSEAVETLSDLALRRTSLAITGELSSELISELEQIMIAEKPLSPDVAADQRRTLINELSQFHAVSQEMLEARDSENYREWSKQCG